MSHVYSLYKHYLFLLRCCNFTWCTNISAIFCDVSTSVFQLLCFNFGVRTLPSSAMYQVTSIGERTLPSSAMFQLPPVYEHYLHPHGIKLLPSVYEHCFLLQCFNFLWCTNITFICNVSSYFGR